MATEPSRASFTILLVEDDTIVCTTIGRMIAREFPEATVLTAANGQIGLELFREHIPPIVITDINLPLMDGVEMSTAIRSLSTDTMFIVLTGYSDPHHQERFDEIGCEAYMIKPVDFRRLFAAIERCREALYPEIGRSENRS